MGMLDVGLLPLVEPPAPDMSRRQMRPLLAWSLRDADPPRPAPGMYDDATQMTLTSTGTPLIKASAGHDEVTITEAGRENPDAPVWVGEDTETRAGRDPGDAEARLDEDTFTKASRDPGDPGYLFGGPSGDAATGLISF